MSATTTPATTDRRGVDRGQLALAVGVGVLGVVVVVDAATLDIGFADPVGPRVFPYVVGAALVVLSCLFVAATLRGDRAVVEGGEDVDVTQGTDWVTVARLLAVFVANVALVDLLGWAITGALLFAGSAWALGSRTPVRDLLVGVVMSVSSWYFFYVVLGIPLTAGVLDGVL